jgi:ADP-heptose:LPS heptosyltransferase
MTKKTIIIRHTRAAGDILVLTAVVRDIYKAYSDRFEIGVETPFMELWENNPYIVKLKDKRLGAGVYTLSYGDGIQKAGKEPIHFLQAFHDDFKKKTGLTVPLTEPRPDIHLSDVEKNKRFIDGRYWVVLSGGKADFTTKHPRFFDIQDTVDTLSQLGIKCVQVGAKGGKPASLHRTLDNAIDLRGQTSLRDLLSLIYNSDGVMCTITFAMHAAAALERPCVVTAGGREEWWWEGYVRENPAFKGLNVNVPHKFLHTMGMLDCCRGPRACWKNKVTKAEGDKSYCSYPHLEPEGQTVPLCQHMIGAGKIIESVMSYYVDGLLPPLEDWKDTNMLPSIDKPTFVILPDGRRAKLEVTIEDNAEVTSKRRLEIPVVTPNKKPEHRDLIVNLVETSLKSSPLDNPVIGGKVTLCVLVYGNYFDMHKRCLGALAHVPRERLGLRVYLNNACQETVDMAEAMYKSSRIEALYRSDTNKFKYPCMRQMFHDPDNPIDTKWVIWFDDDTMADVDNYWLEKLCQAAIDASGSDKNLGMIGSRYFFSMNKEHINWVKSADWYKNREFRDKAGNQAPNGFKIHFASGSCWMLKTECIKQCDIPDKRLKHNGGDIAIGEQIWQNGWNLKNWNSDKRIVLWSSVPRRGHQESIFGI